jgi:hypothetical protein
MLLSRRCRRSRRVERRVRTLRPVTSKPRPPRRQRLPHGRRPTQANRASKNAPPQDPRPAPALSACRHAARPCEVPARPPRRACRKERQINRLFPCRRQRSWPRSRRPGHPSRRRLRPRPSQPYRRETRVPPAPPRVALRIPSRHRRRWARRHPSPIRHNQGRM